MSRTLDSARMPRLADKYRDEEAKRGEVKVVKEKIKSKKK